ncbi:MAG: Uncharacterized protein G01um101430_12 [Parcubacteria group bacterium Gr01-1014_30]|nr:MAG: Uncharacterized protein G01um101430_12 [Parcubacteria group bacterium Gr01-1014_30]
MMKTSNCQGFTPLVVLGKKFFTKKFFPLNRRGRTEKHMFVQNRYLMHKGKLLTGFTLTELLVVIGVLLILTGISASAILVLQRESDLNRSADEVINALRLAQNRTLASEGADQWGVYFDNTGITHQYTLFKGSDYVSRDTSFDTTNKLASSVEIFDINLGGGSEIVFERITGLASQFGSISLRLKSDTSRVREIFIQESGRVTLDQETSPPDTDRIADSRHVHVDYSRLIDTMSEILTLTFDGGVSQDIIISQNLQGGQIFWEGEVDVSGDLQKIQIQTHRLNNPDTQFSIKRDRRYNNKSLIIPIDQDASGSIIEYSTDGLNVTSTSIFVTQFQWQ